MIEESSVSAYVQAMIWHWEVVPIELSHEPLTKHWFGPTIFVRKLFIANCELRVLSPTSKYVVGKQLIPLRILWWSLKDVGKASKMVKVVKVKNDNTKSNDLCYHKKSLEEEL